MRCNAKHHAPELTHPKNDRDIQRNKYFHIYSCIYIYIYVYLFIYLFSYLFISINIQTHTHTNIMASKINRNYWKTIEILSKINLKPFWSRACPIVFSQKSNFNRRLVLFKNQSIYWFFSIVEPLGLQVLPRKIINREQHLRPKLDKKWRTRPQKKATKAAFRNSTKNVGT